MRSTSGQKCRPATERPRTWDRNQPDLGQKPAGPATQQAWTSDGKENRFHTGAQQAWTGDGKENRSHTRAQQAWTGDGNSRTRNNIVWAPEKQHRSPGWQGTAGPGTGRNSTRDGTEQYQRQGGVVPEKRRGHSQKNVVFKEKKKTDNRPPGCVDGRNGGRFLWK